MNHSASPTPPAASPHRRPDYLGRHFPELGNAPLSTRDFFTPEYHALEKERIFKKCWLRIAREEELPKPGDYVVRELEAADTSLIVVRGMDGRVRAFHNACSHRTNRVAYHPQGNTRGFVCRFHSWAYDTQGALVTVPEQEIFPNLDKCAHGLTAVACETWESFVYVNVDPNPTQGLREYLGEDIWNGFAGHLERMHHAMTLTITVKANWKILLDAFLESYHFSTVHAPTAGELANSPANPNGYMDAARFYGPHRVISALSNPEHKLTLCETLARRYSGNMTLAPDEATAARIPPFVNPRGFKEWFTDVLILFPMANFQVTPGFTLAQNYWPVDHETTRWEFMMYTTEARTAAHEVAHEYNRVFLRDVVREDIPNIEWIQKNLRSGAKATQQLADQEILIRHSYKTVADYVGFGY